MKLLQVLSVGVLSTIVAGTATAQTDSKFKLPVAIGAEIGTTGLGINGVVTVNDRMSIQAGVAGMSAKYDSDPEAFDDVTAHGQFKMANPYIGVQIRPMKNAVTLTSGLTKFSKDPLKVTVKPAIGDTIEIDDATYTVNADNARVDTTLNFKKSVAPYFTVGLHSQNYKKVGLFGEVGAIYTGGLKTDADLTASLTSETGATINQDSAQLARLEADLNKEMKKEYEEAVEGYDKFYPVAKVGIKVKF